MMGKIKRQVEYLSFFNGKKSLLYILLFFLLGLKETDGKQPFACCFMSEILKCLVLASSSNLFSRFQGQNLNWWADHASR